MTKKKTEAVPVVDRTERRAKIKVITSLSILFVWPLFAFHNYGDIKEQRIGSFQKFNSEWVSYAECMRDLAVQTGRSRYRAMNSDKSNGSNEITYWSGAGWSGGFSTSCGAQPSIPKWTTGDAIGAAIQAIVTGPLYHVGDWISGWVNGDSKW